MATDVPVDGDGLEKNSVGQCHLLILTEIEPVKDDGSRGNVGPAALAQLRSVIVDLLDLHESSADLRAGRGRCSGGVERDHVSEGP